MAPAQAITRAAIPNVRLIIVVSFRFPRVVRHAPRLRCKIGSRSG
jgi:hypothetical protein